MPKMRHTLIELVTDHILLFRYEMNRFGGNVDEYNVKKFAFLRENCKNLMDLIDSQTKEYINGKLSEELVGEDEESS